LLPALARARDKAKAAACLSQEKQLGLATALYTGENDDWLPNCYQPLAVSGIPWYRMLAPYMPVDGSRTVLQCPANPTNYFHPDQDHASQPYYHDLMVVNYSYYRQVGDMVWYTWYATGDARGASWMSQYGPKRSNRVADSSAAVLVADGTGNTAWLANKQGTGGNGDQLYSFAFPRVTVDGYYTFASDYVEYRHDGRMALNVLLVDGHAGAARMGWPYNHSYPFGWANDPAMSDGQ